MTVILRRTPAWQDISQAADSSFGFPSMEDRALCHDRRHLEFPDGWISAHIPVDLKARTGSIVHADVLEDRLQLPELILSRS
jgi:hypothetical protein